MVLIHPQGPSIEKVFMERNYGTCVAVERRPTSVTLRNLGSFLLTFVVPGAERVTMVPLGYVLEGCYKQSCCITERGPGCKGLRKA